MTRREELIHRLERSPEEQVDALLVLVRQLTPDEVMDSQPTRRELPAFVGMGRSGRRDISERADEYLAEGFGR